MEKFVKKCDCCGTVFNDGYYDNGHYWCSMVCLIKENKKNNPHYDEVEWELEVISNPDLCYYSEWEQNDIDEPKFYNKDGVEFYSDRDFELYNALNKLHSIIDSITDSSISDMIPEYLYTTLTGTLSENETLLKSIEDGKK